MLANLVLPSFVDEPPTFRRERRNTFTYQATGSMRTKTDEKRYQVAKEILDTEKKYLSCLRALKEVFEGPIRENNLIPSKEIDVLFPEELLQILRSHTLFMKDLEERLQSWKLQGIVGDIFTKLSGSYHIDVLRIYSNYVNNFPRAIAVINKNLRGSHKFRKFLQNCSCNAECEGLDLPAFLLTPIQRLPRYVLLLRQLSKYTDPEHPDSFHIENALETMKQMINVLNDSIHSSCKLASNSQIRRSLKKKSLRKKGRELQKNRQNLHENERVSLDSSSVSTLSVDSPGPSSICLLQDGSPEQSSTQLINGEHSTPSPLRNGEPRWRSVSSAELESYIERENQEEFSVITEENEDHKENKGSSHSKFRMAADSLKRNWQRRSKKWRRSAEVDEHERHEVTETSAKEKETEENHDTLDRNTEEICHESLKDENDNLNETPPKSPTGKSRKLAQVLPPLRTRPVSLVLTSESQLLNHQRKLKGKVRSDTDLSKDKSPDRSPEIWILRQKKRVLQRTTSDGLRQVLRSRNSSLASGDTSSISGSKKSLSHISQESLADSGVSERPACSPSNTLNRRTRKVLSVSLTNVSATTETKKKLIQLNRRSWGEWVSAEMESEPSGSVEGRGCEPNEENTFVKESGCEANEENMSKSKRKFRDVVKKLFASKKKGSLEETSSRKRTSASSPTEVGEKISTV